MRNFVRATTTPTPRWRTALQYHAPAARVTSVNRVATASPKNPVRAVAKARAFRPASLDDTNSHVFYPPQGPAMQIGPAGGRPASDVVRIPLRQFPGQPPSFSESDIILRDGDVVMIESRDADVFYTGGLLGGGRFRLPRDQDLDVLQALALVQGERLTVLPTRAIGGISAVNQDVTPGASDLIVLRSLPGGGQIRILVDLHDAIRSPGDRINVHPGDHLILRYKRGEAIAAFFERHILDNAVLGASSGLFFNN